MSMDISKLTPGQILYDVSRQRMGNTTLRTTRVFRVKITAVTEGFNMFWASWNGNPAERYHAVPSSWKAKKPYIVQGRMGNRKATRDEIKRGRIEERADCFAVHLGGGQVAMGTKPARPNIQIGTAQDWLDWKFRAEWRRRIRDFLDICNPAQLRAVAEAIRWKPPEGAREKGGR